MRTKKPVSKKASAITTDSSRLPATESVLVVVHGKVASREEIGLRAYLKWEAAGRPEGDGVGFWLDAETELRATK
jgi:hypothetical protein